MIRTKLLEKKGRKVVVGAEMMTLAGETLADAKYVLSLKLTSGKRVLTADLDWNQGDLRRAQVGVDARRLGRPRAPRDQGRRLSRTGAASRGDQGGYVGRHRLETGRADAAALESSAGM